MDKFKGSLSASEASQSLHTGLTASAPEGTVHCRILPLADGGDGSVQAALQVGFTPLTVPVAGPAGTPAMTTVALNATTAVVEVATSSGLQMLPPGQLSPLDSNTLGFGQPVHAVLGQGARQVILSLGGSATTDGGAGRHAQRAGGTVSRLGRKSLYPTGATLKDNEWLGLLHDPVTSDPAVALPATPSTAKSPL
ncbi:glycerate kinase [Brevibacterium permense]